jgi:hypothetical protein
MVVVVVVVVAAGMLIARSIGCYGSSQVDVTALVTGKRRFVEVSEDGGYRGLLYVRIECV